MTPGVALNGLSQGGTPYLDVRLTKEKQISSDPIREELLRLRKELEETKLERDILKKAVGIFSKRDG